MAANNMISYSQHIWNDMRNIIQMIIDEHGKDFAVEVVREGVAAGKTQNMLQNF